MSGSPSSSRYTPGRCCYCGAPVRGVVCAAHRDLCRLDPVFQVERLAGTVSRRKPAPTCAEPVERDTVGGA